MKRSSVIAFALFTLACGGSETATTVSEAKEAATEAYESVKPEGAPADRTEMQSEAACEILKAGGLNDVFGAAEDSWSFRPASKVVPQALCTATGKSQDGASSWEVSLTIMRDRYDSPDAAVASLESTVKSLSEGITIKVAGKVADQGTRFAVSVHGAGDPAQNKTLAIELARRIGDAL